MKENNTKGTEEQADLLHGLVTAELIARITSGECTAADLKNAMEWLKAHGITRFAGDGVPKPATISEELGALGAPSPDEPHLPELRLDYGS